MEKANLFISYSHADKDYLKDLKVFLNEKNCPTINIWDDGSIDPGTEWDDEIKNKLNKSDIIILLISQSFLNSNYIEKVEFELAIKRHYINACKIIPIYAKKCNLSAYPQITKFQGLPVDKQFFSDMNDEKYSHYEIIQRRINDLATHILTEKNISQSIVKRDEKSETAKEIEKLRNRKKIFLSLPDSEEGKRIRKAFFYQVEGKIKYENWPYEIVPGIADSEEININNGSNHLSSLIGESIYSIHIVTTVNSLSNGNDKLQYDLAKVNTSSVSPYKNIIWLSNGELKALLPTDLIKVPIVIGNNYESIFETIKSFDIEKENEINSLKKEFSPEKRVFMFYDFYRDHENMLRIKLKSKIEENEKVSVWFSSPNASLEKDKEDLDKCDGGCIFYGDADKQWFIMRQFILRDLKNATKAICLDEPEIETKINRDVMKNDFITIRGNTELEPKIQNFIDRLLQSPIQISR